MTSIPPEPTPTPTDMPWWRSRIFVGGAVAAIGFVINGYIAFTDADQITITEAIVNGGGFLSALTVIGSRLLQRWAPGLSWL